MFDFFQYQFANNLPQTWRKAGWSLPSTKVDCKRPDNTMAVMMAILVPIVLFISFTCVYALRIPNAWKLRVKSGQSLSASGGADEKYRAVNVLKNLEG